jgi:phosphatidylserine/phosphatidylglycerophosphate/cardiolipin synthase-like enzyme
MSIESLFNVGTNPADTAASNKRAEEIATKFAEFIGKAHKSLFIVIYHFRLQANEAQTVLNAIKEAVDRHVDVRVAYYYEKPRKSGTGHHIDQGGGNYDKPDLNALSDTGATLKPIHGISIDLSTLGEIVDEQPIEGSSLMHNKYIVRDGDSVWTGTGNFTTEAWSVQDNNFLIFEKESELAHYYLLDFFDLWESGKVAQSGKNDHGSLKIDGVDVEVDFSPGDGKAIEQRLADIIDEAQSSIRVASMVISSGLVMDALLKANEKGIPVTGVYDEGMMQMVENDWAKAIARNPDGPSVTKKDQWEALKHHLVAKHSKHFNKHDDPTQFNFMHCKTIVIDEDTVMTGSFNFSGNATKNAENVVTIRDNTKVESYVKYIDELIETYQSAP